MDRTIFCLFLLFLLLAKSSSAQQQKNRLSFQQLDSLQKITPKPALVFIHTNWCRYCQAMDKSTFQDKKVKELLEKSFYFIELDAEETMAIPLQGHTFRYRPTGQGTGQHELAQALGTIKGSLSFPTLCFLNSEFEIIYQYAGFLTAPELLDLLQKLKSGLD